MAMKVSEFLKSVGIEEKMRNGQPLTAEEQEYATAHKLQCPKLCGHKGCAQPFGPGEGGAYSISGTPVCSDCYFESLDAEVERHPIGRLRPHGSAPGL